MDIAKLKAEQILKSKGVSVMCPTCKNVFVAKSMSTTCPSCHNTFSVNFG